MCSDGIRNLRKKQVGYHSRQLNTPRYGDWGPPKPIQGKIKRFETVLHILNQNANEKANQTHSKLPPVHVIPPDINPTPAQTTCTQLETEANPRAPKAMYDQMI